MSAIRDDEFDRAAELAEAIEQATEAGEAWRQLDADRGRVQDEMDRAEAEIREANRRVFELLRERGMVL